MNEAQNVRVSWSSVPAAWQPKDSPAALRALFATLSDADRKIDAALAAANAYTSTTTSTMIRGQKIELDLGSDSEGDDAQYDQQVPSVLPSAFVGNVLERKVAAPKPPSAPTLKSKSGFPEHKERTVVGSRFKQQQSKQLHPPPPDVPGINKSAASSISRDDGALSSGKAKSWEEEEKERIDQENRQKLASMSAEEIEEERQELMNSLSPALLQRLLARSNVGSGSNEVNLSQVSASRVSPTPTGIGKKTVMFAKEPQFEDSEKDEVLQTENSKPAEPAVESLPHDSVHFPRPPQPPSLDPSSETFLEDLHQKYFPSLPADPDKLEWMQPSNAKNTYDPAASALNASDVRFSFKGELIPPSRAQEIPVTLGLHHHGDAPDAAGYTIAELAHLARSSYPAQRCIAFQTLGRILYKLSKGEFGDPGEPEQVLAGDVVEGPENTFGELARGLWREVERLQVIPVLVDESEGRGVDGGRHLSAKAYATEAVWLWRKGGGRRWDAK